LKNNYCGEKMKHIFIVNPVAGKGKTLSFIEKIKKIINDKEDNIIEITQKVGHAAEISRYYSSQEECRIYAVGGDGTLNEVLNGMAETKSQLAVIPAGSGNDFAKNIYPAKYESNDLLKRIITAKTQDIDLAKFNDKYFINIASIGFDADVALNADLFKKNKFMNGSMAYFLSIFKTLLKNKNNLVEVIIDDNIRISKNVLLLAVANGMCYGGGLRIAPKAIINDGYFDVCIAEHISSLKIMSLLPKLLNGTHEKAKEVKFYKAKKISIKSEMPITLNMDGEISKGYSGDIEIIPKGVKIVMPFEIIFNIV
jgi:YegS/Rv2252/BmrU family lipid kinase